MKCIIKEAEMLQLYTKKEENIKNPDLLVPKSEVNSLRSDIFRDLILKKKQDNNNQNIGKEENIQKYEKIVREIDN